MTEKRKRTLFPKRGVSCCAMQMMHTGINESEQLPAAHVSPNTITPGKEGLFRGIRREILLYLPSMPASPLYFSVKVTRKINEVFTVPKNKIQ